MARLDITVSGEDHRTLDRSVGRIVAGIPAGEVADVQVGLLPRSGVLQRRRITLAEPSEKISAALARIDIPQNVQVSVREPR